MSQQSSFNNNSFRQNDYFDSLAMDSPVAHSRNVSRFSRLADRSRSLFSSSSIGLMNDESNVTFNQSSISDLHSQTQINSPFHQPSFANPNLSSSIVIPSETSNTLMASSDVTHHPPPPQYHHQDHQDTITEDEMARLSIFESFFQLNQKYIMQQSQLDIFQMMDMFEQTCDDNLIVTKRLLKNKNQPEFQLNYLDKFLHLIQLERNVWCLLKVLLGDRFTNNQLHPSSQQQYPSNNNRIVDMDIEEDMRLRLNDSELVERAMERNSMLREMQIIIDWLESVYQEEDDLPEKMKYFDTQYWEHTLHNLKRNSQTQPSLGSSSSTAINILSKNSRNFCSEMDPDAPIRNNQALFDEDRDDENRLFLYLFKLIRAGKLPEGKVMAEKFGFFWLSAALEGWIFQNDRNFNESTGISLENANSQMFSSPNSRMSMATQYSSDTMKHLAPIEGNPYRDLWKHSAWICSKMEGTNLYERAIFAIFSGNRSVLMPLCNEWMDKLWAYFKCSLDVHLENLLMDTTISKPDMLPRKNVDLPDSYWDNRLTPEEIFHELETKFNLQPSSFINRFEEECYRALVKDVILSKIDSLIDHLYEWSKLIQTKREIRSKPSSTAEKASTLGNKLKDSEEELMAKLIEPNLLRLFAHMIICLKELNLINLEKHSDLCVEILEIYIGFLIEYKLVELIAFYTSFLPETKQVRTFATLLETIDDESDRSVCLIIAKNAKLNLSAILTLVVENIRLNKTGYQSFVSKMIPYASFGQLAGDQQPMAGSRTDARSRIGLLSTAVTEDDIRKIQALDWLLIDGDNPQYLELLWQANALIRYFLLEQKIDQALATFQKMPSDIVNRAYHEWKSSLNFDFGFQMENVVREYLCHSVYFEASEAFKKWHHFLYTTKPREPVKPKVSLTRIADRVLHEQRVKQYKQEMDHWQAQITIQAANTSKKLLAFLCFPQGIWVDLENMNLIQEIDEEQQHFRTAMDTESILSTEIVLAFSGNDGGVPVSSSNMVEDDDVDDGRLSPIRHQLGSTSLHKEREMLIKQQRERKRNEWQHSRPGQLDVLRRIYVPQFVFLLQSVYKDSGDMKQCVRVADLVADENQALHKTFTQEQIADFLSKIREITIDILHHTLDPFGCDLDH